MKKLIFLLSLLSFLPVSFAQWTYIGVDKNSNSKIYLNFDAIGKSGDIRTTWILIDQDKLRHYYDHPNIPFLSSMHLISLSCKHPKVVQVGGLLFSKNNASGVVIYDNTSSKTYIPWDYIISDKSLDILFPHLCKS